VGVRGPLTPLAQGGRGATTPSGERGCTAEDRHEPGSRRQVDPPGKDQLDAVRATGRNRTVNSAVRGRRRLRSGWRLGWGGPGGDGRMRGWGPEWQVGKFARTGAYECLTEI
jgi:hypothetical protein